MGEHAAHPGRQALRRRQAEPPDRRQGRRPGPREDRPRHAPPPQGLAHPLHGQVLRLPDLHEEGDLHQHGLRQHHEGRLQLHRLHGPQAARNQPRELLHQPLRSQALQHVLRVLHREPLGPPPVRDRRLLGQPARQGPLHLRGHQGHLRQGLQQEEPQGRDLPHRGVRLPEARPRPALGGHGGRGQEDGRHHPHELPGDPHPQGREQPDHRRHLRGRRSRARAHGRHRHLLDAAEGPRRGHERRARARARHRSGPPLPRLHDARRPGQEAQPREQDRHQDHGQHRPRLLGLRPGAQGQDGPLPDLQQLVAVPGPGPREHRLARPRVLRAGGRRVLDDEGRGLLRVRRRRDDQARPHHLQGRRARFPR